MNAHNQVSFSVTPYPGLRPFLSTEADIFFGREEQADQLLKKLQTSHFLAVIGPSGCGKSSLVRAGMISALMAGFLADAGGSWRIAEMRPGDRPIKRLTEALTADLALGPEVGSTPDAGALLQAALERGPLGLLEVMRESPMPKHANLLLLVDQFEEIFRYREEGDCDEAEAFVALLLATANQSDVPIYIVITMRSDYLNQCSLFTGLPEAMNESQFLTPRLTREQSAAAIAKPVRIFDGRVDPSLVNRLLNDMGADVNQLPLLQHCLMRMWNQAKADAEGKTLAGGQPGEPVTITLDHYFSVGTLDQALSTHADEVLQSLTKEQQNIAQVMFRRLTERSSSGRDTRHPARLGEIARIAGVEAGEVMAVVEEFRESNRSFLTPPQGTPLTPETILDISHESLISLWHTLDHWVQEEADSATVYARLKQTAHLWDKQDADLLGAIDLARAQAWLGTQQPTVDWALRYGTQDDFKRAMAFLGASSEKQNQLKKKEERRRRNRVILAYSIVVILGGLCIFSWMQWRAAHKALVAAEAEAERTRRLSYDVNINFAQREFDQRRPGWIPSLLDEFLDPRLRHLRGFEWYYFWRLVHRERGTLAGHQQEIYAVAFSPDGKILATASRDTTIKLWDTATHANVATLKGHQNSVTCVAFSPDGKILGSGSWDKTVKLWDVTTQQELATLTGHADTVFSVAFSPDGKTVATGSADKTVRLWNLTTHGQVAMLEGHSDSVNSISFSLTRPAIATATWNGEIRIWDTSTYKPIASTSVRGKPYAIAFSPDGKTLAGSDSEDVKFWDSVTLKEVKTLKGHTDSVFALAFSHDGKFLATASGDRTAKLWAVAGGEEVTTYAGHSESVLAIGFSPDDNTLVTGSKDRTAKFWDRTRPIDLTELTAPGVLYSIAFSPDRTTIAAGTSEGPVLLFDARSLSELAKLSGQVSTVFAVAFSPDGKMLATASADKTVWIWDVAARSALAKITLKEGLYPRVVFSPDGKLLAVASGSAVMLWDVATRTEVTTFTGHTDDVYSVAFSPDGTMVAAGSRDGTVTLFDVRNRKLLDTLNANGEMILAVVFSPDGKLLATGSYEKNVTLWDTATRKPLKLFAAHSGPVASLAFSPDGKTLASGSVDKTVKLWDTTSLQSLATLIGPTGWISSIAFSPDGNTLAAAYNSNIKFWLAATEEQVTNQTK